MVFFQFNRLGNFPRLPLLNVRIDEVLNRITYTLIVFGYWKYIFKFNTVLNFR